MTRLVIVADDLTGAADSAAALACAESTSVVLDADGDWPADDVVAVDTDSRHRTPGQAAARVAAPASRAARLGAQVFKKVDSTLRGNIAAEVHAAADAVAGTADRPLIVVAPAFPGTGRTTVRGVVHVHGDRLAAHDSDGDVARLLRNGGLSTTGIRVEQLTDPVPLAAVLDETHAAGVDAVVVDAELDEHLALVAAASRLAQRPVLLVGSGGLARQLGEEPAAPREKPHGSAVKRSRLGGRALVVVGSYSAEARAQRASLVAGGVPAVLLADDEHRTAERVRAALRAGSVVLGPDPGVPVVRGRAADVAASLARVVTGALDLAETLVLTGGETARTVLLHAGIDRLTVRGELEPGLVASHAPGRGVDVVTKAGAFGDPDALLRCLAPHPDAPTPKES